jgi:hypothetical protein
MSNIIEINPSIIDITDITDSGFKLHEHDSENDADTEDFSQHKPPVNFGGGIELLMNEKNKNEKKGSSIEIEDIMKLEDELNDLTNNIDITNEPSISKNESSNKKTIFGGLFGDKNGPNIKQVSENSGSKVNNESDLGKSTAKLNENRTWDGFGKFNNVPTDLDKTNKKPELTKEEELKEKFKYLRKLDDLEKKGVSLSKRYNMESNLQEMMGEYETILSEKERTNSVKFQGKMMMACVTGLEFLNSKFDPFDIKLDGWGEQLNENIEEYDDIFGELHEKYKSKAKMTPELKLLFQLGGSAIMVHMSNTLFKSSMPGMDDIMRQNPELMKQFTQAAVNTMGQTNPGFSGFMNNVFSGQGQNQGQSQNRENGIGSGANPGFGGNFDSRPMPPNANIGPPPPPSETKLPERSHRTQNLPNRPDLMSARGGGGVSVDQNEGNIYDEPRITRQEMRGPSPNTHTAIPTHNAVNDLLSGLKTKQININQNNEASTISIEDLKDLTSAKVPKSKRKQKSDKNIVSLDI